LARVIDEGRLATMPWNPPLEVTSMALPELMSPVPVSLTIVTVGAKMLYHAVSSRSVPFVRPPSVNPSKTNVL